MNQEPFSGYICWQPERISQVINKEAVSVDITNFMATHTPISSIRYLKSPQEVQSTSETDLLKELIGCEQRDQHAFMVIRGIPGTGKSHLIRWLKERYQSETPEGKKNHVLLIERAQNSLLGTLQQIINSTEFDVPAMRNQLDKLRSASETLSQKAREESLLDNLRIATFEVKLPEEQQPKSKIRKNIEHFLLDPLVRKWMIEGPIRRISTALVVGTHQGEELEFIPDDFQVNSDFLYQIRSQGPYPTTLRLAESLLDEPVRTDLALYLNRLLGYAIGRTTSLSADDLRRMFNDLRRHLREQGHTLTLFIEDITSFRGVDTGLIDVLATQHTGEANREFCRILSVVGVTDSYYDTRFPDNLRERITHLLTLSSNDTLSPESELLKEESMTASLAARYLNAMRVSEEALQHWYRNGSRIEDLPNACMTCPFRTPCHQAFGTVQLEESAPESAIGLYPFNSRALQTMYERLDSTKVTRTPRTLLDSILLYVLQSHGRKIGWHQFPPAPQQLGVDFTAPSLRQPTHQRIIHDQAGHDSLRVETTLLFWGNGTAYASVDDQGHAVGTVHDNVFRAFSLPVIAGVTNQRSESALNTPAAPTVNSTNTPPPRANTPLPHPAEAPAAPGTTPSVPLPPAESKYVTDITAWHRGQKLVYYEDLRKWMVAYIGSAIDWEQYGITSRQRDERLTPRRFAIEDQTGSTKGQYYTFTRSDQLAYALQALAAIYDSGQPTSNMSLGTHLVNLRVWLRQIEPTVVAFVQGYQSVSEEPRPLLRMVLTNVLWLDCLSGRLKISDEDSRTLFLRLIQIATQTQQRTLTPVAWEQQLLDSSLHSSTFQRLLKGLGNERFNTVQNLLLQQINLAQGRSSTVLYIDAPTALDSLEAFKAQDWDISHLPQFTQLLSSDGLWGPTLYIYERLQQSLDTILEETRRWRQEQLARTQAYMGDQTPEEVARAIRSLLVFLKQQQVAYDSSLEELLSRNTALSRAIDTLSATVNQKKRSEYALRISASTKAVETVQQFLDSVDRFATHFRKHETQLDRTIAQHAGDAALRLHDEATRFYEQIERILEQLTSSQVQGGRS